MTAKTKFYDLARMTTPTTGTGTLSLGSAAPGFLSFVGAGAQDGDVVTYAISDGSNTEIGYGTYSAGAQTLTRTVLKSTNSGSQISLSGNAVVFITVAAENVIGADVGAHKYWRLGEMSSTFTVSQTDVGFAEISLRATAGGSTQTPTSASASTNFSGATPGNAIDGSTSTHWDAGSYDFQPWFQLYFASPVVVAEIAITCRDATAGYPALAPTSFNLYFSDDGQTFFPVAKCTTTGTPGNSVILTFPVPTTRL